MPNFRFLINRLVFLFPFLNSGNVWEQSEIVEQYGTRDDLYCPEQIILDLIKPEASKMKMLDLGVGAGRTTTNFAPLMKEYVGIDASESMIGFCKKRFKDYDFLFKVVDAKNLNAFSDDEFDFILFSFNGLDCLNHEDRKKTLSEIYRILKPDGYFCFSSHNLNSVWKYWVISNGAVSSIFLKLRQLLLLRLYNRKNWKILRKRNKKIGHTTVIDGAHNFGVRNYYITLTEQVDQLTATHFQKIKVYNLAGKTPDLSNIESDDDAWLYYLCRK